MHISPKIGIMTFHAAHNNGAALQAYALQQNLSLLGADAELIRFYDRHNEKRTVSHSHLYNLLHNPSFIVNLVFHFRRTLKLRGKSILTDKAFQVFHKNYLRTSNEPYYSYEDLIDANTRYNGFVTGSDMVWTPIGQNLSAYFLQFADRGKRFSYSPSLTGTRKFTEEQHCQIQKYIREMDIISCREREGIDYVNITVGKDAVLTLDPTLLFDKTAWATHLNLEIDKESKPYILCYMFDELSKAHQKILSSYAKHRGLEIRYIPMTGAQREYEVDHGYNCGYGPREFVELFLNASFIITNTYHGLMFSLISEAPFVLIHRGSDNQWKSNEERMSNILELLNLSERYIDTNETIPESFFELDYQTINQIIEQEREKSLSFLSKIVEIASYQKISDRPIVHNVSELSRKDCTGCGVCSSVCPFSAISMANDDEGFRVPFVDIDKCKQCNRCVSICPSINDKPYFHRPIASYAGVSKDVFVNSSASGGTFITIARYFIEKLHGVVYGAVFDDNQHCVHQRATSMEDV
ncbi:MAG: polysaccharide pyruvyl transferase family protein, partial [Candidatus Cryptobacteroides sp.]